GLVAVFLIILAVVRIAEDAIAGPTAAATAVAAAARSPAAARTGAAQLHSALAADLARPEDQVLDGVNASDELLVRLLPRGDGQDVAGDVIGQQFALSGFCQQKAKQAGHGDPAEVDGDGLVG